MLPIEKIDETDLRILRILQKDAKKTTKEIAEMLSGKDISDSAMIHAKELLS